MRRHSEQIEIHDWLASKEWNIFGTLKFHPVRHIGANDAQKVIRHFWNRLDRVVYGKAAERGCRVQRWCFAHEGSHSDNYHVHFIAKSPISEDDFCCLSNVLWTKQDRSTASIQKNWITPVIHRDRVLYYLTKEVWKLGSISFDAALSYESTVQFHDSESNREAQRLRISRAVTSNELRAAQAALTLHKSETEVRLALRDRKQSGKAT